MPIVSLQFAAFVAIVVLGHACLRPRWQVPWLIAASLAYQASWAWQLAALAAAATAMNVAVLSLVRSRGRVWRDLAIAANLLLLGVLRWHPIGGGLATLGASFYALRAVSLLVDVSTRVLPRWTASEVALYLLYFPAVVAGPLERASPFVATLRRERRVDDATTARALALVSTGVVRKVVLADPLAAVLPKAAFLAPATLDGSVLAAALVGYAFVLYNDFAGYTDIVRGVSSLFGIPLPENFAQPFFARSFSEFWTRWHASLMRWLWTYVYMPVSRAMLRRSPGLRSLPNLVVPPVVTLLASGVWHGSGAHFVLWGGVHGVYLAVERIASMRPRTRKAMARGRQIVAATRVFVLGTLALVLFRLPSSDALAFWRALAAWHAPVMPDAAVILPIGASLGLDALQRATGDEVPFVTWRHATRVGLLAVVLLLGFWFTRAGMPEPFVYQGF